MTGGAAAAGAGPSSSAAAAATARTGRAQLNQPPLRARGAGQPAVPPPPPAARGPAPAWIQGLPYTDEQKEAIYSASELAVTEFEAAADCHARRQAVEQVVKQLYTFEAFDVPDAQVQLWSRYAALYRLQQRFELPTEVSDAEIKDPPQRPEDADTNRVAMEYYQQLLAAAREAALKEKQQRKKIDNKELLGQNLCTWAKVLSYMVHAIVLREQQRRGQRPQRRQRRQQQDEPSGGDDEEDEGQGPWLTAGQEVEQQAEGEGVARQTLDRHINACKWHLEVFKCPAHLQRIVPPTQADRLYGRFKQLPSERRSELIKAVKDMPTVKKSDVEELLLEDRFLTTAQREKRTKADRAKAAAQPLVEAAKTSASKASAAAGDAKKHRDEAERLEKEAERQQRTGASSQAIAATATAAQASATSASQSATAAQLASEATETAAVAAVRAAGTHKATKSLVVDATVANEDAKAAHVSAQEHAAAAETAADHAKAIADALDQPGGTATGEDDGETLDDEDPFDTALQRLDQGRHAGRQGGPPGSEARLLGGQEGPLDGAAPGPATAAKCSHVSPEWWFSFFQPYVKSAQLPGDGQQDDSSSNSSSSSGDEGDRQQQQIKQLTRRLICGMFSSCCPELLSDVDMAMQLAAEAAKGMIGALQSAEGAVDSAAGSGSSSGRHLQAVEEEITVCRDAVKLLLQGKQQEAEDMMSNTAAEQDHAVRLEPSSQILLVPFCSGGELGHV